MDDSRRFGHNGKSKIRIDVVAIHRRMLLIVGSFWNRIHQVCAQFVCRNLPVVILVRVIRREPKQQFFRENAIGYFFEFVRKLGTA